MLTVNRGDLGSNAAVRSTGIDKRPTDEVVTVRAPGPMRGGLGSGVVGDAIGNRKLHGGDDQAVYAYAREDLDTWQRQLGRDLGNGMFGENLTTSGLDVTGALIGERWRIGSDGLVLEVTRPRTPCKTFAAKMGIDGWIKTFTHGGVPGAYLRVIEPGPLRGGDPVEIIERPNHGVTIGMAFRALTVEPSLLGDILAADALPEELKQLARKRSGA